MGDEPANRGSDRAGIDWRGRVSGICLGLATGVGWNLASDGIVGWLGVAGAVMLVGILSAVRWLRDQDLPPRAPLARFTIPVLLVLAAMAMVSSLLVPADWTRPMVLTTVMLVAAAVLIPTSVGVALSLLIGAAGIGVGVGLAGGAVGFLLDGRTLTGAAGLGLGVGLAGGAVGFLLDGRTLVGAERIGAGPALADGGTQSPRRSVVLLGAGRLGAGTAVAAMGTGLLFHGETLIGAAGLGGGAAVGCFGMGAFPLE